ncbi:MAG TPA: GAF domain-containing protein, partial [Phototrophicaceae bacterium]|nr:GAF domain-containing protein [Phototrophicaceae bacterium]
MVSLSHAVVEIYRLNNVSDWHCMMPEILCKLGSASRVDRVSLFQVTLDNQNCLTVSEIVAWSEDGRKPVIYHQSLYQIGLGALEDTLIQGENFIACGNTLAVDHERVFFSPDVNHSFIVPIHVCNRLWGFVRFDSHDDTSVWTQNQRNIVQAAVGQIATAIERIECQIDHEQHEQRLSRLYGMMQQTDLSQEERVQALMEIGLEELELDFAIISQVGEEDYMIMAAYPEDAG